MTFDPPSTRTGIGRSSNNLAIKCHQRIAQQGRAFCFRYGFHVRKGTLYSGFICTVNFPGVNLPERGAISMGKEAGFSMKIESESVSNLHSLFSQTEFESIFDLLPVAIAIACDPECRVVRTNSAFNFMLGLGPNENASKTGTGAEQLPFRIFRDGEELNSRDLPMRIAAREGRPVEGSRCEIRRADGKKFTIYGTVRPLFDAEGNSRGSIGAFMNITERELLVQELRAALAPVHVLRGLLPICAYCKQIREPDGRWTQMEAYISRNSEADFSHSVCPSCLTGVLADLNNKKRPF